MKDRGPQAHAPDLWPFGQADIGCVVYLAKGYPSADIEHLLKKAQEGFHLLKHGYNRRIYVEGGEEGEHAKTLLIKVDEPFRRFRWLRGLRFSLDSPQRRAWRAADRLCRAGVPVPAPIAVIERRTCGMLVQSALLMQYLPCTQNLAQALETGDVTHATRFFTHAVDTLSALHRHGVYHGDPNGHNFLIQGDALYLTDFEAARLYRRLPIHRRIKDVLRIHRVMMRAIPASERSDLLKRYEGAGIALCGGGIEKIERHNRKKLFSQVKSKGPQALSHMQYAIRRILVVILRYIGDTLLMTSVLSPLKKIFPEAKIDIMVSCGTEAMLWNHPDVNAVFTHDRRWPLWKALHFVSALRRVGYDLAIDFTDSDRSAWFAYASGAPLCMGYDGRHMRHRFLHNLHVRADAGTLHQLHRHHAMICAMGRPVMQALPALFLSHDEMQAVRCKLQQEGVAPPFIVMHPGARRWYKRWPLEYFAALADRILQSPPFAIVLAGGPSDREATMRIAQDMRHQATNLAGRLSLRELAGLIKMASLCVVNDSAPLHIAAAVGTPTVALFGLTDPNIWAPWDKQHHIIERACPCRPNGHKRECDQGDNHCMRKISVDEVFSAVTASLVSQGSLKREALQDTALDQ